MEPTVERLSVVSEVICDGSPQSSCFLEEKLNRVSHIGLMASYNQWMNEKVYKAAFQLPVTELVADRGAFFGSILSTLNHIAVADTIWLKRFSSHPANYKILQQLSTQNPESLDQMLFSELTLLYSYRKDLDGIIVAWVSTITDADLDYELHYKNMKGIGATKNFYSLLMHFFNHQTHHRGQATTLFSQVGIDVGVTDLLAIIPNQTDA
jgi:uncharacterized damage-inducible protein DinB